MPLPDHVVKAVTGSADSADRGCAWTSCNRACGFTCTRTGPRWPSEVLVTAGGASTEPDAIAHLNQAPAERRIATAEAALAGWLQADGFVGQYEQGTNRSLTIEFQVAGDEEFAWVMENLDIALPHVHRHVRDVETSD